MKIQRVADYRQKWMSPGKSPEKTFTSFLIRYGVKGYHYGVVVNEVDIDVLFPFKGSPRFPIAIKINGFSDDEINQLEQFGIFSLNISSEFDETWLNALSSITEIPINKLEVKNPSMLRSIDYDVKTLIEEMFAINKDL